MQDFVVAAGHAGLNTKFVAGFQHVLIWLQFDAVAHVYDVLGATPEHEPTPAAVV